MSITSMSARAGMAQKLSIPQLQQAIQDGTVPAYVGIPLLQDKVKQQKEAMALQGQQKPPSVAEQVMAEANQADRGVPSLPTNLAPSGMAGGGIVAFAEGGMYDDEDTDEDRLDSDRQAEINALMDEYAQAFEGGIGQLPAAENVPHTKEDASDFVARIMHKESRGRRYDKQGNLLTSEKGAMGEMQVMPGTVRDPGFGVKPAQSGHPDELARVGRDYANTLLARYGDPKLAAIAYNMGPGATDKWLAAGADMSKLPKETQGYVKGFAEGGDVSDSKHAGVWPYNAPEAGKFTYGDMLDEDAKKALAFSSAPLAAAGDVLLSPITGLRKMVRNPLDKSEEPSWTPLYDARNRYLYGEDKKAEPVSAPAEKGLPSIARGRPTMANDPRLIGAAKPAQKVNPYDTEDSRVVEAVKPVATEGTKAEPNKFADIEDILKQRYANIDKQREQDKYMALLSAGLGMMSGTSPNAFANIGAGAQQGIQSLAQSNAARTAEENALLSGRLGLAKIGGAKEQAEAMMQLRRDLAGQTNERLKQSAAEQTALRQTSTEERIRKNTEESLNQMEKLATTQYLAKMKGQIIPGQEDAIKAQALEELRANPRYRKLYIERYGIDPISETGKSGSGTMSAERAGQFKVER